MAAAAPGLAPQGRVLRHARSKHHFPMALRPGSPPGHANARYMLQNGVGGDCINLELWSIRLEMASPLVHYCRELLQASQDLLEPALSGLSPFVETALAGDAGACSATSETGAAS